MRKGWEIKKLGEVCIVERGSSPRPIKKYITNSEDGVNWIKIGDTKGVSKYLFFTNEKITSEGAKRSRFVKEGDFILSNSMSFGNPFIMKTQGYIHDGWFVIRLPDYIDTDYFYYLLSSPNVQKQIHSLASGAIVKNISGDLVRKVILTYPKSLSEQKRIVAILDEAFAAIDKAKANAEKNLQNAKNLFESFLQNIFATPGEDWEARRLGEVCDLITDGTHFSPENTTHGDYKYVTAKNIKPYYIDLSNISYITAKDHKEIYARCPVKKGDVLYIKDGATAGIATINSIDEEFSLLSSVALLKPSSALLNTFLLHYMNSALGKKNFLGYVDGAAITRLTLVKIKNVIIPIPSIKTQKSIVNKLDALSVETKKLKSIYQQRLNNLEELKKSILQKAFNGELTYALEKVTA